MFAVPELLYIPRERGDSAVPQRRVLSVTTTTAASVVDATSEATPNDDVFVVTNISLLASAGAAQTVTRYAVGIRDQANADIVDVLQEPATVAGAQVDGKQRSVWLVLMPGDRINARVTFNAGAAANTVVLALHGVRFNRGNWQYG